jgi:hypothetical protein
LSVAKEILKVAIFASILLVGGLGSPVEQEEMAIIGKTLIAPSEMMCFIFKFILIYISFFIFTYLTCINLLYF